MGGSEDKHWEDGQNGLPSMSGSGHPFGGGIQTEDDRRRIILPVETEIESTVFGVRGGYGVGVAGIPPTDSARERNRRETALGEQPPPEESHAPIRWLSQPWGD